IVDVDCIAMLRLRATLTREAMHGQSPLRCLGVLGLKFSEVFSIKTDHEDDWFDPVLTVDAHLFIDPFLLYAHEKEDFLGSHAEVIAFFNSVFQLIARSQGNEHSILWRKAVSLLRFPEVSELCLGYTGAGTNGSGSGSGLARIIAGALWEAVRAGVEEITHFEEIGILREGLGADRISVIPEGLIRMRLATYTRAICTRHHVTVVLARYTRGHYDVTVERWLPLKTQLPRNPYSGSLY